MWLPVNDDGVRGRVILVATGAVLEAAAADELVSEQHSPEVRVLAGPLVGNQLRRRERGGGREGEVRWPPHIVSQPHSCSE